MFANQPFITELSVNSNFIYALPSDLFDYTEQLEVLDMKNNNIKELPQTTFLNTKALRQIDFSNNNLDTICKGLFAYQECFNIDIIRLSSYCSDGVSNSCLLGDALSP